MRLGNTKAGDVLRLKLTMTSDEAKQFSERYPAKSRRYSMTHDGSKLIVRPDLSGMKLSPLQAKHPKSIWMLMQAVVHRREPLMPRFAAADVPKEAVQVLDGDVGISIDLDQVEQLPVTRKSAKPRRASKVPSVNTAPAGNGSDDEQREQREIDEQFRLLRPHVLQLRGMVARLNEARHRLPPGVISFDMLNGGDLELVVAVQLRYS